MNQLENKTNTFDIVPTYVCIYVPLYIYIYIKKSRAAKW